MSTVAGGRTTFPGRLDCRVLARILDEGYGPGAWHGPNLKAALSEASPQLAFWRPARERHNIAEIALHHAYCARSVRGRLSGAPPEPFILEGDDWFALPDESRAAWPDILSLVEDEHRRLAALVDELGTGRAQPALPEAECFEIVLGITCHAVYHTGQVQLIKRLHAG